VDGWDGARIPVVLPKESAVPHKVPTPRFHGSVAALAGVLIALVAATPSSAGSGLVSATCNSNRWYGSPHVYVDSRQLRPVGGRATQWVAAREAVYNYETRVTTWGSWDVYLASSNPDEGYTTVGDPDFRLGAGWYAVRVVAYAWDGRAWQGPTTNMWVPFGQNGYWCRGR
jgi:hypothetical protein